MAISSTRTKRKTKKKTRSKGSSSPRGILPRAFIHPMNMKSSMRCLPLFKTCSAAAVMILLAVAMMKAQEPSPPPPGAPQESSPASTEKPGKKKSSHAHDFLIHGTVFNEKALSFPGVELRIRVAGEKKYRWETYTNSRGEFAVRVGQGADYEMLVRVKGFADQTRTVNAKKGEDEETVVFLMQPLAGGKK